MTTLEDDRAEVAGKLDGLEVELAGGTATLKALDYMSENVEPPVFVVVPGSPYLQPSGETVRFGHKLVTWQVVVLVTREASKAAAAAIDALVLAAWDALEDDYDVISASQPGTVTYPNSGLKFLGSVITVQHDVRL